MEDNLKNKSKGIEDLNNCNNFKNENNIKNEDNIKNKEDLKNKDNHKCTDYLFNPVCTDPLAHYSCTGGGGRSNVELSNQRNGNISSIFLNSC